MQTASLDVWVSGREAKHLAFATLIASGAEIPPMPPTKIPQLTSAEDMAPPAGQQGEVAGRQEGVSLGAHPAGVEELVGVLLLHGLPSSHGKYGRGSEKCYHGSNLVPPVNIPIPTKID